MESIVRKRERELTTGLDEIILSLYARGQSVDDVRHHLRHIYGLEISEGTISATRYAIPPGLLEHEKGKLYVVI